MLIASMVGAVVGTVTWLKRRKAVRRGREEMARVEACRSGFGRFDGKLEITRGGEIQHAQVHVSRTEDEGGKVRTMIRFLYPPVLTQASWTTDSGTEGRGPHTHHGRDECFAESAFSEPAVLGALLLRRDLAPENQNGLIPHFVKSLIVDGIEYILIDRHPAAKSPYFKKVRTWVDARRHVICREQFLGRKNRVLAEREFSDWHEFRPASYIALKISGRMTDTGEWVEAIYTECHFPQGIHDLPGAGTLRPDAAYSEA